MIKVVKIDGRKPSEIEEMLNNNPSWKLITFGTTKYSETHQIKTSRGNIMTSDPPKKYNFMVLESIGDKIVEFKK